MKKLFAACHNYPTTRDGSYFKELREAWGCSQEGFCSRFIICETDWQPTPDLIDVLEKGEFETWYRDLSLSMIQAAAQFVIDVNKIYLPGEIPPGTEKDVEKDIRRQCKPIGFKFSKFPRSGGKCRYRLTDLESGLFFSHKDLRWMLAVVEAARKEDSEQKASKPVEKKRVEIFDPFNL